MNTNTDTHSNETQVENSGIYSSEQLRKAVNVYRIRFEDAVPLGLITAAASAFRSSELMTNLLDRVRTNQPVGNWKQYSDDFFCGQSQEICNDRDRSALFLIK